MYRFWLHGFKGVIQIIEVGDRFAVHRISSKIIKLCNFFFTKVSHEKFFTSVDRKTFLLLLHIPSEIKVVWSSTKNVIIQPRQYIFADGVQSDMLRYIKEKSGGIVVAKDAVTSLVTVWDGEGAQGLNFLVVALLLNFLPVWPVTGELSLKQPDISRPIEGLIDVESSNREVKKNG